MGDASVTVAKKRKKYLGPESDFWDQCKGQAVRIEFRQEGVDPVTVRLDWVDRYTVGVRDIKSGQRRMLFKSVLASIERNREDGPTATAF
jgi:hypothetical protein